MMGVRSSRSSTARAFLTLPFRRSLDAVSGLKQMAPQNGAIERIRLRGADERAKQESRSDEAAHIMSRCWRDSPVPALNDLLFLQSFQLGCIVADRRQHVRGVGAE